MVFADNLGTVRDVAKFNSVTLQVDVTNHITYDAFGNITKEFDSTVDHIFGYTGRETDEESDLYYYRARYYDPFTAQFISKDPIESRERVLHQREHAGPANGACFLPDAKMMVSCGMRRVGRRDVGGEINLRTNRYKRTVFEASSATSRTNFGTA